MRARESRSWTHVTCALAIAASCSPAGLESGKVQFVGWAFSLAGPELLLLDAASPNEPRVLIEGRAGQAFSKVSWSLDGDSLVVLRELGGETELLKIDVDLGTTTTLHAFPGLTLAEVEVHRQPDGGLVGLSGAGGDLSLLTLRAEETTVESHDLADLGLGPGFWHVAPSTAQEFIVHRAVHLSEASPAGDYALVFDVQLEVLRTYRAADDLEVRCVGAADGEALACELTDESYARDSILLHRGKAGWGEPFELGAGPVHHFSGDSGTLVAADAVYSVGPAPEAAIQLATDSDFGERVGGPRLSALTRDGNFFTYGASEEVVLDVHTGEKVVTARHVNVDGDEPFPPTWSWDGDWLYRGQCARPTEADTYYCEGMFVARAELSSSCVSQDEQAYNALEKCETFSARGLSDAVARPRP